MNEILRLAARIDVPEYMLPTACVTPRDSLPSIEVHNSGYQYVVVERGEETERFVTTDLDALLFKVFWSITFHQAIRYEAQHRVPGRDPRRLIWQRQEELLTALSVTWGEKVARQHQHRVARHPFRDE